jgi:hypothetical protein
MSEKAAFYVAPWAVVKAEQARFEATTAGVARDPFVCHNSLHSVQDDADPTRLVLAHVHWKNDWSARERFEALPGVLPLGESWELLPAAAVPVLEQFRSSFASVRAERVPIRGVASRPTLDVTAPIDVTHTVVEALRKAQPHLAHELF